MAIEIERKFLVKNENYKLGAISKYYIQGYLCTDPEKTVRVRIAEEKGFITIKGKNKGICRKEYEYEINKKDAEEILKLFIKKGIVEKIRWRKDFGNGEVWEIDEFIGDNKGLTVAEIELKNENENFNKPEWVGKEISNEEKYYNSNLSINPYKNW